MKERLNLSTVIFIVIIATLSLVSNLASADSTDSLTITEEGNVGIGTTNPAGKFHSIISTNAQMVLSTSDFSQNTTGSGMYIITGAATGDTYTNIQAFDQGFASSNNLTLNPFGGNVGIGTTNPATKLDVSTNVKIFSNAPRLWLHDSVDTNHYKWIGAWDGNIRIGEGDSSLSTTATYVTITDTGDVGIGTTSPSYPLHMGGGAYCTGTTWVNASSRQYKENIRELTKEEAKATLEKLSPKKFNYKSDKEEEYLGFIAEDVPELVANKDRKGLSAMDIVAVLTKVVQVQQAQIEEFKKENDELQTRIANLEKKL